MKVITLNEFGENNFIKILDDLIKSNHDRNNSWFPNLKKNFKTKYVEWFFLIDKEELVAFSAIQKFGPSCFRVLTRCFIFEKYRRPVLPKKDKFISPATHMILKQIEYLNQYDTLFISLEYISRKNAIINMANKMSLCTKKEWLIGDGMFKTCNDDSKQCWQNICYTGKHPDFQRISYNEWKRRYLLN